MSGEEYLLSLLHKKAETANTEHTYINQRACPFVRYYKDRLTVKYLGKGLLYSDITSIQSNKPANRDGLLYYYEVKINDIGHRGDIVLGLADGDFPLNKHPGWTKKSFGYKADGKVYSNKQPGEIVMPKFTTGSYVGCGINYLKREIFFTFNGEYHGPAFKDIELKEYFATIGLHSLNESVTLNFGNKPFKFDIEKMLLDEKRESVKSILKQPINHYSLHQIVHSYLNFHGYAHTLEAFEASAQIERRDVGLPRREVFMETEDIKDNKGDDDFEDEEGKGQKRKRKKTLDGDNGEMEIETKKEREADNNNNNNENNNSSNGVNGSNHNDQIERRMSYDISRYRSESLQIEFESPNFTSIKDNNHTEIEPLSLNRENNNSHNKDFILFKKASFHIDPRTTNNNMISTEINSHINEESQTLGRIQEEPKLNTYLLYERAELRQLLLDGKVSEAMNYINKLFPTLLGERPHLLKTLLAQQFIEYIKVKDNDNALSFAQTKLTPYLRENIYVLDERGIIQEKPIDNMMGLLCYPDPENSNLKGFLEVSHRDLTADIVNREILGKMGFIDRSILDILISQLVQTENTYRQHNSYYGQVFEFKV